MALVRERKESIAFRHAPQVGRWSILLAILLTVGPFLVAVVFRGAVADFKTLFAGFGVELPLLTAFVVSHILLTWFSLQIAAALQAVFLVLLVVNRTFAARRAFFAVSAPSFVIAIVVIEALYAPIFTMGSVI